jgi:hypothetical protein
VIALDQFDPPSVEEMNPTVNWQVLELQLLFG